MDIEHFIKLNNTAQIDYVLMKLSQAHSLMKIIYDSMSIAPEDAIIKEIEKLGDNFVMFGIEAEEGRSAEIFDRLNSDIIRLNQIADIVRAGAAN